MNKTIHTIGHSTHPIEEFINILQAFAIGLVVDVRTIPKSRYNPQFNQIELERDLQGQDIGYIHLKELGGLRHTTKSSTNTGWRNSSFRGFADYMQTAEFAENLQKLIELGKTKRTVIMCAEAVWWRCHRRIIADYLLTADESVMHILGTSHVDEASLTPGAVVRDDGAIIYPAEAQLELKL